MVSEVEEQELRFRPLTRDSLAAVETRIGRLSDNEEIEDSNLKQGRKLPRQIRDDLPPKLTNTALEDIDPFYKDRRTFVVISKGYDIHRFSATNALWIFSPFNLIRRINIFILLQPLFTIFMAVTVLANCLFMTMPATSAIVTANMVCTAIFTFEIIVKVVARGFILQPFTYLRDPWNWLDFIVTILTYIGLGIESILLHFAPTWRSLRLLQVASLFPGLRIFVKSLDKSIPRLKDTIIVSILTVLVLAVFGLEMFMGVLTQKCVKVFDNSTNETYGEFVNNIGNWYYDEILYDIPVCGNSSGSRQCPPGYTCLQGYGATPNYGYTNFDTFGWSLLSSFRLLLRDYWENLYQMILASAGPWHMLFFYVAIFGISFNFMALILTIVTLSYEELQKKAEAENMAEEHDKEKKNRELNSFSKVTTNEDIEEPKSLLSKVTDRLCIWDCCDCWINLQNLITLIVFNPFVEIFFIICIFLNTLFLALDHHDMSVDLEKVLSLANYMFTLVFTIEISLKLIAMNPKFYFKEKWNRFDFVVVLLMVLEMCMEGIAGLSALRAISLLRVLRVFRPLKRLPTLNFLISVILKSLGPIFKLFIVMCAIITIFAITGMHLFGVNYVDNVERFPDEELPRWSFIDLMHSFMVIFRASCGEWIESMWDCMLVGDITCVPFFSSAAFIGYLLIFNLFTAVVLYNFRSCRYEIPEDRYLHGLGKAFHNIIRWKKESKDGHVGASCDIAIDGTTVDKHESAEDCLPEACYQKLPFLRGNDTFTQLRQQIFRLVQSKYFELVIFIIIGYSSLMLTLEDNYLPDRPTLENILYHSDIAIAVLFIIEMLIMWLGLGLNKYFRNGYYWVDFIVVTVLLANFGIQSDVLKAVRALRVLRFIPAINLNAMKVLTNTIRDSIRAIFYMLILCLFIWLTFAILGVQLFAGKFFKCVDDNLTTLSYEIVPDRNSCMVGNYTWLNSVTNFDHVGNAYLALVQLATFKGWIQIMNDAIDSRQLDKQPIREVNIYMYYYFIIFTIFGTFLTLSMFIGIIVTSYGKQRPRNRLNELLETIKARKPAKAIPKPDWKPQAIIYDVVTNKYFELVMFVFIVLNVLIIGMDHYDLKATFAQILDYANLIFIIIFSIECIMKLSAYRCYYFTQCWNWFDFIVVLVSLLGLIVSDPIEKYFVAPALLILLRVIRVVKIRPLVRTLRSFKGIRIVYFTIARSLSSLFCVNFILILVTFIYSIFGMFLFNDSHTTLDDFINFHTFGQSMILLIQISTWAGWDGILYGLLAEETTNCCHAAIIIAYLISFIFISFIIFNLYLSVIFYSYIQAVEEVEKGLTEDDIDMFFATWQQFDPKATKFIRLDQLSDFLTKLEPPFRINKPNKYKITTLDISIQNGELMLCSDVLTSLILDFNGIEASPSRCFKRSSTLNKQRQEYCAKIIQNNWRKFKGIALNRSESGRRDLGMRQTVVLLDTDGKN